MGLTMAILPDALIKLGSVMLLSAFALLFVAGLLLIAKLIFHSAYQYFSSNQRLKRRLLFIQGKQDQINRLLYFRTVQIKYFHEQHKKRVMKANEHKHIQSLSSAIHKDLLAIKKNLPKTAFKQLQRENDRYRVKRDSEALLMLQQKIADITRA